jgi:hypothetical protein
MTTEAAKTFSYLEMEAALCIWECIESWTGGDNPREDWEKLRGEVGSASLRSASIELAPWLLSVFDICTKADRDFFDGIAYDWEVVPMIMNHIDPAKIDWIFYGSEGKPPEAGAVASLVARQHLLDEYIRDCRLEAGRQWAYSDLVSDHAERVESQGFESGDEPKEFVKWLGEKYDLSPV